MKLRLMTLVIGMTAATSMPSTAGNVLKVDPTNPTAYASIQAAVNAASPGDILVVHPKPFISGIANSDLYPAFTIDKSLAVTAETGATVKARGARVENLVPGDQVLLRDIIFERVNPAIESNLVIDNHQGAVWVEGCTLRESMDSTPSLAIPPLAALPAATVTGVLAEPLGFALFVRCTIEGSDGRHGAPASGCFSCQIDAGDGLVVTNCPVAVWDSTILGGTGQNGSASGGFPGGAGGDAVQIPYGYVVASGSTLTGGAGGTGHNLPGVGCVPGGNGGNGLVLLTASWAETLATTPTGGAPGAGAGTCSAGTAGSGVLLLGWSGVSSLSGPSYSLFAESPKREGQNLHLELTGPQNGYYLVEVDVDQQFVYTTQTPPAYVQAVRHIDGIGTPPIHPAFLGQFSSAPAIVQFPLSGLLGGEDAKVFYFQATGIDTYPGGQEANSSPSALVLIDASL